MIRRFLRNSRPFDGVPALAAAHNGIWLMPAAMLLALLCSCASGMGTPPPGGPADTTAPAIVFSNPANGTVNFSERTVTVEFSEYVEESRVQEQVVITPIPPIPPDFDWSGSTLDIEFQEPLAENRTYTVTFGSGIVDLSGNRLGHPFTLRFSTGAEIDSGRIQGEVAGRAEGRAYIYAYLIPEGNPVFLDTLHPDSTRPDFIAPIGDDGSFSLEGLPVGEFRIFAVVDDFGDQLYTPGQDAYGVPERDLRITSPTEPVTDVRIRLRAAPDDLVAPAIYGATSVTRTRTELRFSEPIDSSTLHPENFGLTAGGTTVAISELWTSAANRLAVQITHAELPAGAEATLTTTSLRDTTGNPLPDSGAVVHFTVTEARDTLPPSLLPPGIDTVTAYTFPDSIRIAFDEAVDIETPGGTVMLRDTAGPSAAFRLVRISAAEFLARPLDTLFGAARGVLEVNLGRFRDKAGNRRDSVALIPLAIGQVRQKGSLQGTITDSAAPDAPHVVTARAMTGGAIYRLTGLHAGPWEFPAVPEGEYEITAFRDSDDDGVYDYGSIIPFRPAEAFVIWQGPVRVRPRWATNQIGLVFR